MRWLELSPGYACNCRCTGCHSCSTDDRDQMATLDALGWLQRGRKEGAQHLWLSGGEPTLRRDFLQLLRAARQLGYQRIKVQSNGMLFSYPQFADKALAAGCTEVNLLVKSLDPELHDRLNQTPGSHRLMEQALAVLAERPVRIEADVLVTALNWQELPQLVEAYAGRGVKHFNFWLFSLVDQGAEDLRALVPTLADCVPQMLQAKRRAAALGATVCSLNTPHCVIPPEDWDMQFDAAGMQLVVVNPDGRSFPLEASAMEMGEYRADCAGCAARPWCHGMRADYLQVHGWAEFVPLERSLLTGQETRGSTLELPRSVKTRQRLPLAVSAGPVE